MADNLSRPWERRPNVGSIAPNQNQRQASFNPEQFNSLMSHGDMSNGSGGIGIGGGGGPPLAGRPALPPRPGNSNSRPVYHGYNSYSPYGGFGSSPYGGYGTSGSYGGYGMYGGVGGMSRYGTMGNGVPDETGFIQTAEESSRQAFQSIESIVHAFGSVSMMLESTYNAVYSSFRAVLGVAEHFSRMKSHFGQIFSALAVVRTLRWILKKLLYLIGLRSQDPNLEAAWRNAANGAASPSTSLLTEADLKASKSSWPIVMFLGVVFAGPYLIWRLLSSIVPPASSPKSPNRSWVKGVGEHYAAVATYSFEAVQKKELPFKANQGLFLAPKELQPQVRGWLLASNGKHVGLVPANYIKILGLRRGPPQPAANVPSQPGPAGSEGDARVSPRIPSFPGMSNVQFSSSAEALPPTNTAVSQTSQVSPDTPGVHGQGVTGQNPSWFGQDMTTAVSSSPGQNSIIAQQGRVGETIIPGQETMLQSTVVPEQRTNMVEGPVTLKQVSSMAPGTVDLKTMAEVMQQSPEIPRDNTQQMPTMEQEFCFVDDGHSSPVSNSEETIPESELVLEERSK